VLAAGDISPGITGVVQSTGGVAGVGTLNVFGDLMQLSTSQLKFDFTDNRPGLGYDQIIVYGDGDQYIPEGSPLVFLNTLWIRGGLDLTLHQTPAATDQLRLIRVDHDDVADGTFTNWTSDEQLIGGDKYLMAYDAADGNDVVVTPDVAGFSLTNLVVNEGNVDSQIVVPVTLSRALTEQVTVDYSIFPVSMSSSDYTASDGTLTFAPGVTSQDISITIHGDVIAEADERLLIQLSGAFGAQLLQPTGVVEVADDDGGFQTIDHRGTDFWVAFPGHFTGGSAHQELSLFITSRTPTSGTVQVVGQTAIPFVTDGVQATEVALPNSLDLEGITDGTLPNGIHVVANDEVSVYGLNHLPFSTDAFLGLPIDALGTRYRIMGWANSPNNVNSIHVPTNVASELTIVSPANGIDVTITPTETVGARLAGQPFTITLNQGDVYQLGKTTGSFDLTGTLVESTQPVGVYGGHECANVPQDVLACDHIVEMLPPTSTWGTKFLTAPLAARLRGDTIRVLADENDTIVNVGGQLVTLQAGEHHETVLTEATEITSNRPILIAQYANSDNFDRVDSDPAMMFIPPTEQFLARYTIATPPNDFDSHYVNVVIHQSAIGSLAVDGQPVLANAFAPVADTGYMFAQLYVGSGSHTLLAAQPFGVYSYGFASFDSYAYPGGLALSSIADATNLMVTPTSESLLLGNEGQLTATVTDAGGNPVVGVRIDFDIVGANDPVAGDIDGFGFSDAAGTVSFSYNGEIGGLDTIDVRSSSLSTTATKTWVTDLPSIEIES
ncbi:MAG: hypothetical protein MI861_14415, partial [Pirellulales bacterium]|nr:hypothetical protein [Pirellulales bacterium]